MVGGAAVPADAISNVTVSPTHRRRGLLSRMMATDLDLAKERGDVVATLIAAEYPIYGRYGFGPATWTTEWQVDVLRAGLDPRRSGPDDGGRIDLVDSADVRKIGPELHDRLRSVQHGLVSRSERVWRLNTGDLRHPGIPWTEPFNAVHRSPDGRIDGLRLWHGRQVGGQGPAQHGDRPRTAGDDHRRPARAVALPAVRRLDQDGQLRQPRPRRPAPAAPSGPARGPGHHPRGSAVDPAAGRTARAGGPYVSGRGPSRPGRPRRRGSGGRPFPAGRLAGRCLLHGDDGHARAVVVGLGPRRALPG